MKQLSPRYNHADYEKKWWQHWEDGGWFHGDEKDTSREAYTVLLPPPNVTDRLHMGHGLNSTIQDILVRWKRMDGYNCCWVPGTDHAGIATQMMVEKSLEKEGVSRKELGREEFLKRCESWKERNGGMIIQQLKRMGASCDWEREAYTMTPSLSQAVRKIFVDLYDKGLIYRKQRLVNWDPKLQTAISDDEVENKDESGHLWHFRYPLVDDEERYLIVATTRPETMLGDTAVAVHPEDARYQDLIGRKVRVPFVDREVPIIADDYVKMEFGTGCVKITPAHDPNDFEMGLRHSLPMINVMTDAGAMTDICKDYEGLDRFAARKAIVKDMDQRGLLEKVESTKHAVPYSERGKVPIEPRLSMQWFVKMQDLAAPAISAVHDGELKFHPESANKTYMHWMENIQDWCISRQLWWGHRIPIWYCRSCDAHTSGMEDPTECKACGHTDLYQDEDVLDTWFSSWLWPLSPFGWPEKTPDFKTFFPTQVLVTAQDIIFLWVARMVMVSCYACDEVPFKDVYFNSLVCDKSGKKFSKTLGNGIDPLEMIDQCGADAVRFTLMNLAPLGGRVKMAKSDFDTGGRLVNKLWNAARFLQTRLEGTEIQDFNPEALDVPTSWLLQEFKETTERMRYGLDSYHMNEASDALYQFIWKAFCDWGVEAFKESSDSKQASVLVYVFEGLLRLASPFMPFVTEEIWDALPPHPRWERASSLVVSDYPKAEAIPSPSAEKSLGWKRMQDLISGIRSVRTQAGVPPKETLDIAVQCDEQVASILKQSLPWVQALSGSGQVDFVSSAEQAPQGSLVATGKGFVAFVPVGEWVDFEKESKRLQTEVQRVEKVLLGLSKKLENQNFVLRAPADVLQSTKAQKENMAAQLIQLKQNLTAVQAGLDCQS
ncbi:MAG: valine--tRNA ligase [Oligoflexales bacterium]